MVKISVSVLVLVAVWLCGVHGDILVPQSCITAPDYTGAVRIRAPHMTRFMVLTGNVTTGILLEACLPFRFASADHSQARPVDAFEEDSMLNGSIVILHYEEWLSMQVEELVTRWQDCGAVAGVFGTMLGTATSLHHLTIS